MSTHKVRVIWEAEMVLTIEAPTEAAARQHVRRMPLPFDGAGPIDAFDFTVRLNSDGDCDCSSCCDDDDDDATDGMGMEDDE